MLDKTFIEVDENSCKFILSTLAADGRNWNGGLGIRTNSLENIFWLSHLSWVCWCILFSYDNCKIGWIKPVFFPLSQPPIKKSITFLEVCRSLTNSHILSVIISWFENNYEWSWRQSHRPRNLNLHRVQWI